MKCPKCHSENPADSRFCSKCAAELSPSEGMPISITKTLEMPTQELAVGSTFAGRYQIIEELGRGGMGRVYKVLDKDIDENVALKLLNPEVAADEKIIKRFQNELKFARKIAHKNVCKMYHLAKKEKTPYITMEYVPGEDLKSSIRRMEQITVEKAVSIAKQICEGLAEAHRLGVVHRDLKPQNVMIDSEGNAHIMDFGISHSLETRGVTEAGEIIGTPEYMSPEQVEGKEVSKRSDIYSLGVILYEMVTGRVPFEGDTALSIALKHKSEMPQKPRQINAQIPENLSRVILKCMEKDKEKRYEGADELLSELVRIEQAIPTAERVVPRRIPLTAKEIIKPNHSTKFHKSKQLLGILLTKEITVQFNVKKLFISVLAIIALAVIVGIILRLIPQKQAVPIPSDKPSLAVMNFTNNTGDENLDHWRMMFSNLLIADLTQSKYIRVLSEQKKNLQMALELIDRVSDRERYIIQGDFFLQSEETYDRAIKAYNKLLKLYPDNIYITNELNSMLYSGKIYIMKVEIAALRSQ